MGDTMGPGAAHRGLLAAAAMVIVVAGLQASGDIMLPILFAVFIAVAMMPLLRALQRAGVPNLLAIPLLVLSLAGLLAGLTGVVAGAVTSFTADIGQYEAPMRKVLNDALATADGAAPDVGRTRLVPLAVRPRRGATVATRRGVGRHVRRAGVGRAHSVRDAAGAHRAVPGGALSR